MDQTNGSVRWLIQTPVHPVTQRDGSSDLGDSGEGMPREEVVVPRAKMANRSVSYCSWIDLGTRNHSLYTRHCPLLAESGIESANKKNPHEGEVIRRPDNPNQLRLHIRRVEVLCRADDSFWHYLPHNQYTQLLTPSITASQGMFYSPDRKSVV